jgi:general secretion pathway protein M
MVRRLSRREKIAVGLTVAVLSAIVLTEWVVLPTFERRDRLERQVASKMTTLEEIHTLAEAYGKVKALADWQQARMKRREKGFTLFSYMDRLAGKAEIKSRITYMRPSTVRDDQQDRQIDRVEMKIQGAAMDRLVRFIHGIEAGESIVWIRRLAISRTGKNEEGLNAVFQVETWAPNTGERALPNTATAKGKA